MQQLSKSKSILLHLYPGVLITLGFIFLTPFFIKYGFPPQFGMLLSIILVAVPILSIHLLQVRKKENRKSIAEINGLTNRLSQSKLILYSIGLVIFAFFIWGATQPINVIITDKLLYWLPPWFTEQDFSNYSKDKIVITLQLNLILN